MNTIQYYNSPKTSSASKEREQIQENQSVWKIDNDIVKHFEVAIGSAEKAWPKFSKWQFEKQSTPDYRTSSEYGVIFPSLFVQVGDYHDFQHIHNAIEKSKYILDLADNWDDEGSIGYDFSTWKRSVDFLLELAQKAYSLCGVLIDTPNIYHGPDGSIDMLWRKRNYKVLVNFPKDASKSASFYGSVSEKETLKGTFTMQSGCNILMFLVGAKKCVW